MRVEYERIDRGTDTGSSTPDRYRYVFRRKGDIEACCEKMAEAITDHLIGFGEQDCLTLNALPKMALWHSRYDCQLEEALDYCPFCGQGIECVEVARFRRVTKKVKRMQVEEVTEEVPE